MTAVLTLKDIPAESDPDCVAARNADHGFYSKIEHDWQRDDCRAALVKYRGKLVERPGLANVIEPIIAELEKMLEAYE